VAILRQLRRSRLYGYLKIENVQRNGNPCRVIGFGHRQVRRPCVSSATGALLTATHFHVRRKGSGWGRGGWGVGLWQRCRKASFGRWRRSTTSPRTKVPIPTKSDCQPAEDFQQKQTSELAKSRLPLGTQGRNQKQVRDRGTHAARADWRACGRTARTSGACSSVWRRYMALQTPHQTRMRTPRPERMAALAHAVSPLDTKTVPRTMSMTWPRFVARAASAALTASMERLRFVCWRGPRS
jgi:hypothetical protein